MVNWKENLRINQPVYSLRDSGTIRSIALELSQESLVVVLFKSPSDVMISRLTMNQSFYHMLSLLSINICPGVL